MTDGINELKHKKSISIPVNIAIAIAVGLWQSYANHWDFAQGIGYALGGYLLAWPIYLLTRFFILKEKSGDSYKKSGLYFNIVSWLLVISPIGTLRLNALEEESNKVKFEISHALGEIAAICEATKHLSTHYCNKFSINNEVRHTCENGAPSLAPHAIKGEIQTAFASDGFKHDIQQLNDKFDREIAAAKLQPNYTDNFICNTYAEYFNKTYDKSIAKLNKLKPEL